jgi:hypothetical protein
VRDNKKQIKTLTTNFLSLDIESYGTNVTLPDVCLRRGLGERARYSRTFGFETARLKENFNGPSGGGHSIGKVNFVSPVPTDTHA